MDWHDFGPLEGPGWAANALGGALLLARWGRWTGTAEPQKAAWSLVRHVLTDGFVRGDGLIWPYFHRGKETFFLNYTHNNRWLCPGSLAHSGLQLLDLAVLCADPDLSHRLETAAAGLMDWLLRHVTLLPNGWVPRRITPGGAHYPQSPTGGPDPIFTHSADGLYLFALAARLAGSLPACRALALQLGDCFVKAGGFWGSINHDTYDVRESVAFAVAFRLLTQAGQALDKPEWLQFARQTALPGLEPFRMFENRNGVATRGLLWMEKSWDTAYLWENAEAAQAWLESWQATAEPAHLAAATATLTAISRHHYGPHGFLTEGIDWNNHIGRRHHIRQELYGAIRYTEPLLNNLHLVGPTLTLLEAMNHMPQPIPPREQQSLLSQARDAGKAPAAGGAGARYYLRLNFPAFESEERLAQALDFTRRSKSDAVLLFEASYDMDPALLTLDTLQARMQRIGEVIPRFREIVGEVHINMMITMGHVDSGCARPERFDFQFLVNQQGQTSRSTACPIDPNFLHHVREQYRMAAECRPDAIWVDDDTRLLIHDLPGVACFCPRHLERFAQVSGKSWQPAELSAALLAEAQGKTAGKLRKHWFDLQEQSILEYVSAIEEAVHAVDSDIRIGLMTVGTSFHAAEGRRTDRLLRTLAGKTRPLLRPGSGFWNDYQPGALVDKTEDAARQVWLVGADVQSLAEIENHPYTPYTKSRKILALEMALDVLAGMPDLSLNLLTIMSGNAPLEPEGSRYAELVAGERPFLDALAHAWSGKQRSGLGLTCSEDTPRVMRLNGDSLNAWMEPRPWEQLLLRLGLPVGRPGDAPHWIAGEVARTLSDYDWGCVLREGAVLDPIAAGILLERGLGQPFGLQASHPLPTAVNERLSADPLTGEHAGKILPVYNHLAPPNLATWQLNAKDARVLSRWLDVDGQDQGPALTLLTGPEGQRLTLLPFRLAAPNPALLNIPRRDLWAAALSWTANRSLPVRTLHGPNLLPYAFHDPDTGGWLIAAANLSADDLPEATLALGFEPREVARLTRAGAWEPCAVQGSQLTASVPAFTLTAWRITP